MDAQTASAADGIQLLQRMAMRQVVLNAPFQLALQPAPEPVAGPGQALVRVRHIGVCGTDLHAYRGRQPYFTYPRVLGHEISAEILAVGENPDGLRVGEACVVSPYLFCGACIACRSGKTNCCMTLKLLGVHVDGGMQDLLAVPAHTLVRADGLTAEQMALVENQAIGAHAVGRAQLAAGETVLVLGAGPIGFGVTQFAKLVGASVLLADLSERRLEIARQWLNLTACLNASDDLDQQLREQTGGDYPVAVFDCTGSPASMMKAFGYVAHGGRLIMVSLVQGEISFNDPEFHRHELTVMSSRNATRGDFERVIAAMATGQIVTEPFTQHRAGLIDLPAAFPAWVQPDSGVLKAMVSL